MLPEEIQDAVASLLSQQTGIDTIINRASTLSGGSINDSYLLDTSSGKFFMKYNLASAYPGMFEQEALGLSLLRSDGQIRVPEVIGADEAGNYSFLVLEYLDPTSKKVDFWESFGRKLAILHKHTSDSFGLDHDNYIGSLKQYNNKHKNWLDFFTEERLGIQIELAQQSDLMPSNLRTSFDRLFNRLNDIFPEEPPSLIHGDLWSGNYMVDDHGDACIIDPAVYFGFREMDIGMSRLFGVFGNGFYEAYNETWPMEPGWQERIEICNLYPLMVHVNLFGVGYLSSVESILSGF